MNTPIFIPSYKVVTIIPENSEHVKKLAALEKELGLDFWTSPGLHEVDIMVTKKQEEKLLKESRKLRLDVKTKIENVQK